MKYLNETFDKHLPFKTKQNRLHHKWTFLTREDQFLFREKAQCFKRKKEVNPYSTKISFLHYVSSI